MLLLSILIFIISDHIWIGANDLDVEGQWKWVSDNSIIEYNAWAPGEPNDQENEDCGHLRDENSEWNDIPCTKKLKYVCKRDTLFRS